MKPKKLLLKIERKLIQIYKLVNRGVYNNRFYVYLRHLGVNVIGQPGFISDDVWVDEVAPEFITIKDRVIISKGVTLLIHDYSANPLFETGEYLFGREGVLLLPIEIEEGAFIGANSILLPGTRIGKNTIVGAGSVVKGHVPESVVIVGNPARVIKTTTEYYEKMKNSNVKNIRF